MPSFFVRANSLARLLAALAIRFFLHAKQYFCLGEDLIVDALQSLHKIFGKTLFIFKRLYH
jgi:hypothetical protein